MSIVSGQRWRVVQQAGQILRKRTQPSTRRRERDKRNTRRRQGKNAADADDDTSQEKIARHRDVSVGFNRFNHLEV